MRKLFRVYGTNTTSGMVHKQSIMDWVGTMDVLVKESKLTTAHAVADHFGTYTTKNNDSTWVLPLPDQSNDSDRVNVPPLPDRSSNNVSDGVPPLADTSDDSDIDSDSE